MDLLALLKDKKSVIASFIKTLSDKTLTVNLRKMNVNSEMSLESKVKIMTEVVANQQVQIKQMSAALLIYAQSNDFDVHTAQALAKMGRGEEALKTMFEQKLNGRS